LNGGQQKHVTHPTLIDENGGQQKHVTHPTSETDNLFFGYSLNISEA